MKQIFKNFLIAFICYLSILALQGFMTNTNVANSYTPTVTLKYFDVGGSTFTLVITESNQPHGCSVHTQLVHGYLRYK